MYRILHIALFVCFFCTACGSDSAYKGLWIEGTKQELFDVELSKITSEDTLSTQKNIADTSEENSLSNIDLKIQTSFSSEKNNTLKEENSVVSNTVKIPSDKGKNEIPSEVIVNNMMRESGLADKKDTVSEVILKGNADKNTAKNREAISEDSLLLQQINSVENKTRVKDSVTVYKKDKIGNVVLEPKNKTGNSLPKSQTQISNFDTYEDTKKEQTIMLDEVVVNGQGVKKTTIDGIPSVEKRNTILDQNLSGLPVTNTLKSDLDQFQLRLLKRANQYETNKTHTILIEIKNNGGDKKGLRVTPVLPEGWKLISVSTIDAMQAKEKRIAIISFFIPSQSEPGPSSVAVRLVEDFSTVALLNAEFQIAENHTVEVFTLHKAERLQAGETVRTTYGIRNTGNIPQYVTLSSRNTIDGESTLLIPVDSTMVVSLVQKTDAKANSYRRISLNLDVRSKQSQKTIYKTQSVEVIPTRTQTKDAFYRFPVTASLYYSSYSNREDHYSTMSAELKGRGFLDVQENHYLNFTIRAPKKENLRRFSVVDQYSLIYSYQDKTTLYLGDHSYILNRLGYGSRYGMGFKVDQVVNQWTLSAFYSKPRLYNLSAKPLYGVRAAFKVSDSLEMGLTLERSEGSSFIYRNNLRNDNKGQIATFNYNYFDKNTNVEAEFSTSYDGKELAYASNLNVSQRIKNLRYTGYVVYADKNYLGTISNSLQLTNSLYYTKNSFDVGAGHSFSRVNKRLDPILFETEPFFESYFVSLGYRFTNKHYLNFRFDSRNREDQLEPKSYHYKEYGVSYNFRYTDKLFSGSFGGRYAKSKNLLLEDLSYRNSYSHMLNVSYKIFRGFDLRSGLNHIYTSRYGYSGTNINYVRYNFGINYKLNKWFGLTANYNSGFSPEERYKKRDYINLNITAQPNKKHRFEVRANYFENPGVQDRKEAFVYGKYSYSFGAPVKRVLEIGGVRGTLSASDSDIDLKGIKLFAGGKTVVTDAYGNFELNNLPVGANYIFIEDTSLPIDVVSTFKNPIEVVVEPDKQKTLDLTLVHTGNLFGKLELQNESIAVHTNVAAYVKIESKNFTYYTEANEKGEFSFLNIVPGDYTFNVIRFKLKGQSFQVGADFFIKVAEKRDTEMVVKVRGKERKVKFKKNNFKVGQI